LNKESIIGQFIILLGALFILAVLGDLFG